MTGELVGQALDRTLKGKSGPRSITVDHGTEFQSRALEDWAYRRGVQLDFIHPGKPVENALLNPLTVVYGTNALTSISSGLSRRPERSSKCGGRIIITVAHIAHSTT